MYDESINGSAVACKPFSHVKNVSDVDKSANMAGVQADISLFMVSVSAEVNSP